MFPEPNFPVRPDEFVGRRDEIDTFLDALRHGLAAGRTSSFAILGEWGIGKSSSLWKFANVCSEPTFSMLPVCLSASGDIHDYLRFAEILLDKLAEALLCHPSVQGRLRTELQDWRFKQAHFGDVAFERESAHRFLSTGTSLLRHALTEAWDRFLRPAGLKGAIFFVDDLQNITSISKRDSPSSSEINSSGSASRCSITTSAFQQGRTFSRKQKHWPTLPCGFTRNCT